MKINKISFPDSRKFEDFIKEDLLNGPANGLLDVLQNGVIQYYIFHDYHMINDIPKEVLKSFIEEIIDIETNDGAAYYRFILKDQTPIKHELIIDTEDVCF